jgi:hypothetical protein
MGRVIAIIDDIDDIDDELAATDPAVFVLRSEAGPHTRREGRELVGIGTGLGDHDAESDLSARDSRR